jgi:hypothetical protein
MYSTGTNPLLQPVEHAWWVSPKGPLFGEENQLVMVDARTITGWETPTTVYTASKDDDCWDAALFSNVPEIWGANTKVPDPDI